MPMLDVDRLSVRYGTKQIVDALSFSVSEGQWLMIAGPNGAGKSTALAAITQGTPYTGRVLFEGQNVRSMKPALRARAIGVLAQNHFVGYGFTVEEVVRLGRFAYAGGVFGRSQEDDAGHVEQALTLTGLQDKRRQSVLTLSGGELQRTFLAQVLAQDPKLLLLDEPTNHLDLIYQKQIFALIGQWLQTPGRAVVSVVHDLSLARAFGTDALLMDEIRANAGDGTKSVYFEVSPLQYGLWTAGSGTFMDEIANMLGLTNCFADVTGWGEISEEQVLERNPDYIVTISMYYGEGPTPEEEILSRTGWENVTAVKNGKILNLPNNELSRPAPRLADGAKALYDFVYGE